MSPLRKINLILVGTSLAALVLLMIYLQQSLSESAIQEWVEHKASSSAQISRWIERALDDAKHQLTRAAEMPAFQSAPDPSLIDRALNGIPEAADPKRRKIMQWLHGDAHNFSVLFLLLPNGDHYISHPFSVQKDLKTYNLSHRPYFIEATQRKKLVVSDSFVGADGVPAVAIDVPILDQNGNIHSHLGGVLYLAKITELLATAGYGAGESTQFLLDGTGELIGQYGPDSDHVKQVLNSKFVQDYLKGIAATQAEPLDQSVPEFTTDTDSEEIIILNKMRNGWTLGSTTNRTRVIQQFTPRVVRTALLAAVLFSIITGLGIFAASRIGLRWQRAEKALKLANEQLEARVRARTAELAAKEEHLATTLNSLGEAVISTNLKGEIIGMNPVAESLTGWTKENALEQPLSNVFNIFSTDDRHPIENLESRVIESGETLELGGNCELVASDGEACLVSVSAAPIRSRDQQITGVVLVFWDITEETQIQQNLVASEERFRAFSSIAADMFWEMDADLRFCYLSGKVKELMGASPNQFIGKRREEAYTDPAILNSPEFQQHLKDMEAHKPFTDLKLHYHQSDGKEVVLNITGIPLFDSDGNFTGYRGVTQDINKQLAAERALRESKAQLQAILDYSPTLISTKDIEGHITLVNQQFKVLGFDDPQSILGKTVYELFPHDVADALWKNDLLAQHKPIEAEEVVQHADGTEHTYWTVKFPLVDEQGELIGTCAISHDITEKLRAEQTMRRTQKMEAIGHLTGGIAHDFNNILGIIIGNLNLLKRHLPDDEKAIRRVEIIKKSAQRAANLTKQLLSFSRQQAAETSVADINRTIDDMDNLIRRSITPEVQVEHAFAENLWKVQIDPGDFQDALLNLVINARDAMPRGGQIVIETHNRTLDKNFCTNHPEFTPGDYVEVTISDSGAGIDKDNLEHIFEPFFTTKPPGKGTGLGLAMVFGFVKRSGGQIKAYSEPGAGTTFHIYLPRVEGEHQEQEGNREELAELPHGAETILVVDDETALLELAGESLQILGYRVYLAENGAQALQILDQHPDIDMLFSDVVMPGGISGYELAELAQKRYPGLAILMTSGYTEKAASRGLNSRLQWPLLNKPYTQVELAHRIRDQLDATNPFPTNPATTSAQKTSFSWKPAYEVGIEEMDEDHHKLLQLLETCDQLVKSGAPAAMLSDAITQLQSYTNSHFQREEQLMERCHYHGLNNHRQVHRLLQKTTGKFVQQLKSEQLNPEELLDFLQRWWVDHIQTMDRAYAIFCLKRNSQ